MYMDILTTDRKGLKKIVKLKISRNLLLKPFPNKPWFLRVCSTSVLKTLWEKKKLFVKSNLSFFAQCFLPIWRTFGHFHRT